MRKSPEARRERETKTGRKRNRNQNAYFIPNMPDLLIEQAIYGSQGAGGYRFLARSPGFRDDWLPEAQRLCTAFGERPAGVACPAAVFAQPLDKQHVAVVQVADQGQDDAGRPGALGFRLLVLPRPVYSRWIGDPFLVAERFPPPWNARGDLPVLTWPDEPLPPRTVEEVRRILGPAGEGPDAGVSQSATLLGGVQALVDGGRLAFERPAPAPDLVRKLWALLPASTRGHLWPASFAFGNDLSFHVLVLPRIRGDEVAGYLTEEQAGDYPEGRYELNLQLAAEAGDQRELDMLFARRSSAETMRLGLILLAVAVILVVAVTLLNAFRNPAPRPANPEPNAAPTSKTSAAPESVPPAAVPAPLTEDERERLREALYELAGQLGVQPLWEPATVESLLTAVEIHLGAPDAAGAAPQRRLQLLLWRNRVAGHDDPRLNPAEMVERLADQTAALRTARRAP